MVLGIGTMAPIGIVGGLFHMINNALYKSCLFLTAGSVERQAGGTDLEKLGGLRNKMPVTFICFAITAVSISGLPPFNGFFSKELIYDAALERGVIFYLACLLGSFFTFASFLKLGHAAFLGKISEDNRKVREAPLAMLAPMIIIAAICVIFGVANFIPLKIFIQPILGAHRLEGKDFSGLPKNMMLVIATIVVLAMALLNHLYGVRKTHTGLGAVDHIYHAPVLSGIYRLAERGYSDPYNIGLVIARIISYIVWGLDRFIDWLYNIFVVKLAFAFSWAARKSHSGNYSHYIAWSLLAAAFIVIVLLRSILA
jgi:NADH-quinone oxidoreductase subunit L